MEHVLISAKANASKVYNHLWIGSAPPIGISVAESGFDCLVLTAIEYQPMPGCFYGVQTYGITLTDDGSEMTSNEMKMAVQAAGRVIKWMSNYQNVLVTCHMGLNRSSLVAALALCKGPHKIPVDKAVQLIRDARGPSALGNSYFVKFLERFCRSSHNLSG